MSDAGRRRRVTILGSTGSVGTQALDVVRAHPERFEVVGLAAYDDALGLATQAWEFGVRDVAMAQPEAAAKVSELVPAARVRDGAEGVRELAAMPDVDVVLNGIVGSRGLAPTLAALDAGGTVALANKESLIVGGDLVISAAGERESGDRGLPARLVPVDSEHSALAQCWRSGSAHEVARIILTASGGPFRGRTREQLAEVTREDALAHPTWSMGPVITVNSATLVNKGLELIEAHLLFGLPWDALGVVVHPQSIVHSMVEFVDGSTIAQMSPPDMRLPIQLALGWPQRLPHAFAVMDWASAATLEFEPLDRDAFPAVGLAEEAGRRGGTYPGVLNAANEQAVGAFLARRVQYLDIARVVEQVMTEHERPVPPGTPVALEDVLDAEAWARARADELLGRSSSLRGGLATPS